MAAAAILDFQKMGISGVRSVKNVKMRQIAKLCGDRSSRCSDMVIFRLFKTAAAAILDLQNLGILGVLRINKVTMRHRAKFGVNRENRC